MSTSSPQGQAPCNWPLNVSNNSSRTRACSRLGGAVEGSDTSEFGYAQIRRTARGGLFVELSDGTDEGGQQLLDVWMSHGDKVSQLPPDFELIAETDSCPIAGMAHRDKPWFGIQFHPEVTHTLKGEEIFRHFVLSICGCEALWTPANIVEDAIARVRDQVGDDKVLLGLSGGVDSSILLALMARLRLMGQVPDHTPRLLAYTVRFDRESVADETRHARMLADHLGAEFIDATYGEDDFITSAGMAVAATGDPVADFAILPGYHLAARARADVKVILTGEGGDEFFAGYGRYRAGMRPFLPKSPTRPGPALKSGLIRADLAQRLGHALMEQSGHLPSFTERLFDRDTALARLQQHDIAEWLPDDLLTKADRCLMHNGIEGRTPFVDRHLSAYGFGLGHADKIRKRDGKYRLKAWLQENLPEAKPFTPKRGFTVPVGEWIAHHAGEFAPLVSRLDSITSIIDIT